jgi:hypothetical protein
MFKWISIAKFVRESEEFKAAWDFQLNHKLSPGIAYDWVATYAMEENRQALASLDSVDSKADGLIRYLGAGSAFVSLLALYSQPGGGQHLWAIAPTLLLLLLSLGCAVIARAPQAHPNPPFTKSAVQFAEFYKENANVRFAMKVGAATVGVKAATQYKAAFVRWSFRFFVLAIAYLSVAITLGL